MAAGFSISPICLHSPDWSYSISSTSRELLYWLHACNYPFYLRASCVIKTSVFFFPCRPQVAVSSAFYHSALRWRLHHSLCTRCFFFCLGGGVGECGFLLRISLLRLASLCLSARRICNAWYKVVCFLSFVFVRILEFRRSGKVWVFRGSWFRKGLQHYL